MGEQCKAHAFHNDVVGSFLRPEYLKEAREQFAKGEITHEELTATEDKAIKALVEEQKAHGLKAVTDGEFRRSWWHFDFWWGLEGLGKEEVAQGKQFHDLETRAESVKLIGKLGGKNHPFVQHFKYLKSIAGDDVVARQSIPAPAQLIRKFVGDDGAFPENPYYADLDAFIDDLAKAYIEVIADLYAAGLRSLQLDDCSWGSLVDPEFKKKCEANGYDFDALADAFLRSNNAVLENLPEDLFVSTHVCRGNYRSSYHSSGSYEPVSAFLLGSEKADAFYLEYDSERAGGFEPLKDWDGESQVVLGLVTSKTPQLEDKEQIISRIREAQKYVPLEKLALSPQCGFSSTEEGNNLTEAEQWAKVDFIKEVVAEVWGA